MNESKKKTYGDYMMYITGIKHPLLALLAWRDYLGFKSTNKNDFPSQFVQNKVLTEALNPHILDALYKQLNFELTDELYDYFINCMWEGSLKSIREYVEGLKPAISTFEKIEWLLKDERISLEFCYDYKKLVGFKIVFATYRTPKTVSND